MSEVVRAPAVVIHQPQYLPYLGYFYKMSLGDVFVSLDRASFTRNKVQNRNVIRGVHGPLPLTVPVRRSHLGTLLCEVEIDNSGPWARKHWKSLEQSYCTYPYFDLYKNELRATYERTWERLVDLNMHLIGLLMRWLELSTPVVRSSELPVEGRQTELLVKVCRQLGAASYISGEGAKAYLEPEQFRDAGIRLCVSRFRHPIYRQPVAPFVPALSTIDLVMSMGPDSTCVLAQARDASELADWNPATA